MKRSLEKATQLELMAAYAEKCKKLEPKDSSFSFKLLDEKNFQIEYEGFGPEKYNTEALLLNTKRQLKEASRLELIAVLAKKLVTMKLPIEESPFDFIKVSDEEFQLQELGNMPTNYLITGILG